MANKKSFYMAIAVLILVMICGVWFFFFNDKGTQTETDISQQTTAEPTSTVDTTMVDCGKGEDPFCFVNRMNECLPVTIEMVGSDNSTKIVMTILGVEDEKCHFQRKINDVLNLNCFFSKGTFTMDVLDQTFGNDKGLQQVVDDACQSGW